MCSDIDTIHRDLLRHLEKDSRSVTISKEFSALKTNSERVNLLYSLIEGYNLFPALSSDLKSDEKAEEYRQKGNMMYKNKKITDALELYTKSVSCGCAKSEQLALAFANRSAALFEIGLYKECLEDIERSLEQNYPEQLKEKVFTRQAKARMLEQTQFFEPHHQDAPIISEEMRNPSIQSATNSVEIKFSEELGRHIVASKNIEIGEIIAVEEPFCSVLIQDFATHCHECLKLTYNLLPCPSCTQAMFCSIDCMNKAQKYHIFECRILKTIRELNLDKMRVIALKIALSVKQEYGEVLNESVSETDIYRSDRYYEIHKLVGNTEYRAVSDLFKRATAAAILYYLVKKFNTFFANESDETAFNEVLLLHIQTAPCNFHEISEICDNNGVFETREIGAGAFSFLSMFNHSCSPNVVRQCHGKTIVLRAIKTIKEGTQCFDNYGYHHAVTPKAERQYKLKEQYFFECICEACLYDWPLHQELAAIETDISIDSTEMSRLMKGDGLCAQEVLIKLLPRIKELEDVQPNKNFSEMQEVVKQCFALLGNKRRSIQ